MSNNFWKTTGTAFLMCLILIAITPSAVAQQKIQVKKSPKIVKVVTPIKHYKKLPHRGAVVTSLPGRTTIIRHGQYSYHYYDGILYRPINSSYLIVAPPVGLRVSLLPVKAYHFLHGGRNYFYYYGTFYISHSDGDYEVVEAPLGARVDALPNGYELFELDGEVYYRLDDTYYKALPQDDGTVIYEVVRT